MTTYGHIIYGTPPTEELLALIAKVPLVDFKEFISRTEGWYEEVSTNKSAFYFGIKLLEIDNTNDYQFIDMLQLQSKIFDAKVQYLRLLRNFRYEVETLELMDDEPLGVNWNEVEKVLLRPEVHIVWYG